MDDRAVQRVSYYAGLSLGQASQYTGLAVLEKRAAAGKYAGEAGGTYAVRHLARFPPGTPYGEVVSAVRTVFDEPPAAGGTLVVDQTAVGRAVLGLFTAAKLKATVRGLTVTAGHDAAYDNGWLVPKKDLVGVLQVVLQGRRIKVAETLEHARTLAAELNQFQLKAVSLDPTVVEWRERPHDDLVLAVAVAAWLAERPGPGFFFAVTPGPPIPTPGWGRRW